MSSNKSITLLLSMFITISPLVSDVPPARLHKPDIPYFMKSLQFQSMQMRVFPSQVSGMVMDPYSDLIWNPAFILQQSGKTVYLDFNYQVETPVFPGQTSTLYGNYYDFTNGYRVLPTWYPNTFVNPVRTDPIYNFAFLSTVSPKISIGFINRSIFDYGPFRSAYQQIWGAYADLALGFDEMKSDLEPQRLEIDNNQQTVPGTQSEVIVGYKVSDRINLAVRLGHYIFKRDGTLYNSKWATYPHSSFANLDDESLNIDGNHVETGVGLLYRLSSNTRFGIYGGFVKGTGSEEIASQDTSNSWWERDTNPDYYRIRKYSLESSESYSSTGERPNMTITFEKDLSSKLTFRSFLYSSWSNMDISGSVSSSDTSYGDHTYDVRRGGPIQRRESDSGRESALDGSGKEKKNQWRWFASLIYAPKGDWSAFGGIQIQHHTLKQEFDESSDYTSHSWTEYTKFESAEYRYYYMHEKLYSVQNKYERWSVFLPIGIRARVVSGLHVILGTDITLTLTDQDSEGDLLYPQRITRRWKDGNLVVEDEEIDRYEQYSSDPAKDFSRSVQQRFGLVYKHPSGATLFIRSFGDILQTANWALGFEMNF